jgi:tetratricopeptide (TPR) repeat protein
MNFKTLPVLALLLCSGQIQAQGKVPKAPAATGWEDVVQQPIAQAVKLREAGKFEQARALLEAKLKTLHQPAHQRELRIALADVHFYWAKSLEARRSHAEAIRHYQAAYAIDRVLRRDDAGMDLQNIGNAYEVLGRYEEALRYYQQALPIRRETKNKRGEAITLISIGLAYKSLRRYEEALRYYQQALLIVREVEDRPG